MKRFGIGLLAVLGAAVFSMTAYATIQGSAHDLSDTANTIHATATGQVEMCAFCHTPHGFTDTPLWNRSYTPGSFTLYSNWSINGTMNQPAGGSLECLSCHDGTVALDNLIKNPMGTVTIVGAAGNTLNATDNPNTYIGTDLSNDHPVGVNWSSAIAADTELQVPTNAVIINDAVECASCHDVHEPGTAGFFLRVDNAGSALCLECHTK